MDLVLERLKKAREAHLEAKKETPFVCATWAQSLDGYISVAKGVQTAISCEETFEMTHEIRAAHDSILVGIGTLLADNPRLNARLKRPVPSPTPVILDSSLRTPTTARLFQVENRKSRPLLFYKASDSRNETRLKEVADVYAIENPADYQYAGVHIPSALGVLGNKNIRSVMVEGGGTILNNVLANSIADYVIVSIAPRLFGSGVSVFRREEEGKGPIPSLRDPTWHTVGSDVVLSGYPQLEK